MPCTNTKTPTGALGDAGGGQPARGGPAWAPPASLGRTRLWAPLPARQDGRGEGTVNESARCAVRVTTKGWQLLEERAWEPSSDLSVSGAAAGAARPPGAPSLHVSVWLTGVSICSQTPLPRRRPRLLPGGTGGGFVRLPVTPAPLPGRLLTYGGRGLPAASAGLGLLGWTRRRCCGSGCRPSR